MNILLLINHVLNFIAPAAVMALALPVLASLAARFSKKKRPDVLNFKARAAIIFVACLALQVVALLALGRDGKMASYVLVVVGAGTCQWIFARGWQG